MIDSNKNLMVKGEIANYWLSEEGILYSYSKSPVRNVKIIGENIALVKQIPLLFQWNCYLQQPLY